MALKDPTIFARTAPAYYARGIPVIPLYPNEKKPRPKDWSRYYDHPVEESQQREWIEGFPDSNIGVVLGPQAGLVVMDIDTTDQALITLIQEILPPSPWVRIGKKGMVLAFKWTGHKTFRVKNTSGETICELLASRTQVVLPPSIHPDTGLAYQANCELLDVIDHLPVLDEQVETILRGAIESYGVQLSHSGWSRVTEYASAGSRDSMLTERAGLFSYAVVKGERTLKEAIGMLHAYHTEFVENVAGDPMDINKHVGNLVKFLHRDVLDKGRILPTGWDAGLTPEDKVELGLQFGRDDEEWTFEELRNYLRSEFEEHLEDSNGRTEAIEKVLTQISRAQHLNKLDEDRLLQYIADVGGLGIKVTSLRARVKELRAGEGVPGTDHTEIAKAVINDIEQLYPIRFYNSFLWKWSGSHWEQLNDNWVQAKIAENYGHLAACKRHSDIRGIYSVVKYLVPQGIRSMEIKGINFANGFLTEDLKLLPHDSAYGMTYTLPFRYMPELAGKSELFWEFLRRSWGEDPDYLEKLDALQEALAVTLFGLGPKFQRAVLLQGAPKSGKSQLLRIASALVTDSARSNIAPNDWGDKFLPTQMHGKLLNVAGELSERKMVDGQKFKDIIDGQEMAGQLKGGQIFNFKPMCTHWFASNHYPRTDDTSEGFNRRWLVLQFNHPVGLGERKLDIGDTIVAEEREAIVAWAVLAMPRLRAKNEFTIPKSHVQVMREVANINNSVRFFIQESGKVRLGPPLQSNGKKLSNHTSETRLYNAYWSFCIGPGGAKPVGSTQFRSKLRELGTEMNFHLDIRETEFGGQEAVFENITLVERVASPSSSGKTSNAATGD